MLDPLLANTWADLAVKDDEEANADDKEVE